MSSSPMTLSELGEKHEISRERIRQIQVRLMEKMREFLKDKIPDFKAQFSDLEEGD